MDKECKGVENFNNIDCTNVSSVKNKTIKQWSFYDQHKLYSFECHTDVHNDKIIKQKFYLNNMLIDVNEIQTLNINNNISNLTNIIKEHEQFIEKVNEYLGRLSFNHKLKYGWRKKEISFILTVYKYKDIECILNFQQNERILNKEELLLFLKKNKHLFEKESDSITEHLNALTLNEKLNDDNSADRNSVKELIQSVDNLTLNEIISKKQQKRDCDFLFIRYPKSKRIEYQACKKYDIEEIEFYKNNMVE